MSEPDGEQPTDQIAPAAGRWPAQGLHDGVVGLRVWQPDDVPSLLALLSDPEMRRWSPTFRPPDQADCAERVRRAQAAAEVGRPDAFAVVEADDPGHVLGSIDWRNGHPLPHFSVLDVGYGVAPQARGRGVASRALRLLSDWLLADDGGDVQRVQLDHAVENEGSCRVALRAGFVVEGRREAFLPLREHADAPVVHHAVCLHGRWRP
jgi:RimJ/RimL family protein N-acetyltransferase